MRRRFISLNTSDDLDNPATIKLSVKRASGRHQAGHLTGVAGLKGALLTRLLKRGVMTRPGIHADEACADRLRPIEKQGVKADADNGNRSQSSGPRALAGFKRGVPDLSSTHSGAR